MLLRRSGRPKSITPASLRVLAVLLLADGRFVPTRRLAAMGVPAARHTSAAVSLHIQTLRRHGVPWIESRRGSGYRLMALPPDWLLEDLLVVVTRLRTEYSGRAFTLRAVRGSATARSPRRSEPTAIRTRATSVAASG